MRQRLALRGDGSVSYSLQSASGALTPSCISASHSRISRAGSAHSAGSGPKRGEGTTRTTYDARRVSQAIYVSGVNDE
jgi:hypothetical protein